MHSGEAFEVWLRPDASVGGSSITHVLEVGEVYSALQDNDTLTLSMV